MVTDWEDTLDGGFGMPLCNLLDALEQDLSYTPCNSNVGGGGKSLCPLPPPPHGYSLPSHHLQSLKSPVSLPPNSPMLDMPNLQQLTYHPFPDLTPPPRAFSSTCPIPDSEHNCFHILHPKHRNRSAGVRTHSATVREQGWIIISCTFAPPRQTTTPSSDIIT